MTTQDCCDQLDKISFHSDMWDQCAFMHDQCIEIAKHKWIESQKNGRDLGSEAVKDWIKKYAQDFREYAIKSGKYFKN